MPKKGANISLTSYDDIFETDESRADLQLERVRKIPIDELRPFQNHPFKVIDDEAMLRTTESIAQFGVLTPLIARPLTEGGYEIISGHRRVHAAEAAGLTEVPVIVRDMSDDEAVVLMVDSNLQRENILPSERAFAYKMKAEALNHQGQRTDLTSVQVEQKSTRMQLANETGQSEATVFRYIRLTNLIPELLDMLDQKQISFLHFAQNFTHVIQGASSFLAEFFQALRLGKRRGGLGEIHGFNQVFLFLRFQIGQLNSRIERNQLLIQHI